MRLSLWYLFGMSAWATIRRRFFRASTWRFFQAILLARPVRTVRARRRFSGLSSDFCRFLAAPFLDTAHYRNLAMCLRAPRSILTFP